MAINSAIFALSEQLIFSDCFYLSADYAKQTYSSIVAQIDSFLAIVRPLINHDKSENCSLKSDDRRTNKEIFN